MRETYTVFVLSKLEKCGFQIMTSSKLSWPVSMLPRCNSYVSRLQSGLPSSGLHKYQQPQPQAHSNQIEISGRRLLERQQKKGLLCQLFNSDYCTGRGILVAMIYHQCSFHCQHSNYRGHFLAVMNSCSARAGGTYILFKVFLFINTTFR